MVEPRPKKVDRTDLHHIESPARDRSALDPIQEAQAAFDFPMEAHAGVADRRRQARLSRSRRSASPRRPFR
jgi:hypothetical protein